LDDYVNNGYIVLLPQNGSNRIAGAGSWAGYGLLAYYSDPYFQELEFDISGGYHGGFDSDLNAVPDPVYVDVSGYLQPKLWSLPPALLPSATGADPVNMADGAFQIESTDLSLGSAEPRGLNLGRYYSSSRRTRNLAGVAPGWLHNYYIN